MKSRRRKFTKDFKAKAAVEAGHRVLFLTLETLITRLTRAQCQGTRSFTKLGDTNFYDTVPFSFRGLGSGKGLPSAVSVIV